MKSINFFLVITALFLTCSTGFAQSAKDKSKAVEKADKLNIELKSVDPALALSESQMEQIIALEMQNIEELSAFSENNSDKKVVKAKSKELKKAMKSKIKDDIFTPEQAKAHKAYRKNGKGEKGERVAKAEKPNNPVETMTDAEADKINTSASEKDKKRAEKATDKLNASLIASDANLALSADQKEQINILNLKRYVERSKMKEAGVAKDEFKTKSKELSKSNKRDIKNILTKEQNAVLKASKGKKK